MSLLEKIREDMKSATKSRDLVALSALRMALSALKNREIELRKELDDAEVVRVISSLIKQRKESIELYEKGEREDLAEKERKEIEVLQKYLPPELSREELEKIVRETISEVGAASVKEMGKVMKAVMPKVAGRADGKVVSEMVRSILSG
ncbi:MAG: GatB/YqeY domain-containing protein [Deltaproteobacteria bacterium]|nr:MAG: GatB/YqeY domain-containing protein [Deltaproteobacteria bacterium]